MKPILNIFNSHLFPPLLCPISKQQTKNHATMIPNLATLGMMIDIALECCPD